MLQGAHRLQCSTCSLEYKVLCMLAALLLENEPVVSMYIT